MTKDVFSRWLCLLCGCWLFASVFIWGHSGYHYFNSLGVGVAIALVSMLAMWQSSLRFLNAFVALWLFLSCWGFPDTERATLTNNLIIAVVVFFAALAPWPWNDYPPRHRTYPFSASASR